MPLAYTTKRIGTSCFLVEPDVYRILEWVNETAARHGAECLPEVHDHTKLPVCDQPPQYASLCVRPAPFVAVHAARQQQRLLEELAAHVPAQQHHGAGYPRRYLFPDVEGVLPRTRFAN